MLTNDDDYDDYYDDHDDEEGHFIDNQSNNDVNNPYNIEPQPVDQYFRGNQQFHDSFAEPLGQSWNENRQPPRGSNNYGDEEQTSPGNENLVKDQENLNLSPDSKSGSLTWKLILAISLVAILGAAGMLLWIFTSGPMSSTATNMTNPEERDSNEFSQGLTNSTSTHKNSTEKGKEDKTKISKPPSKFKLVCSKESVINDVSKAQECKEICKVAACCYASSTDTGFTSCHTDNEDICLLYSPLCDFIFGPINSKFNKNEMNSAISGNKTEISSNLEMSKKVNIHCGSNVSTIKCNSACYSGNCCFSSAIEILDGEKMILPSCYNSQSCNNYMPCLLNTIRRISPPSEIQKLPNPPDDLNEICSKESLETQAGAVICMSHCAKAQCCVDSPPNSCIEENISKCSKYSPCSGILKYLSNGKENEISPNKTEEEHLALPLPPPDLDKICDPNIMKSSKEKITACAVECEVALCCFAEENSCLQNETNTCLSYFSCQSLIDLLDQISTVPYPAQDIKKTCAESSMSDRKARDKCAQKCSKGICCFSPRDSCFVKNVFQCLDYSPCTAVINLDDGTFIGNDSFLDSPPKNETEMDSGNETKVDIPPPPPNIAKVCAGDALEDEESMCFDICLKASCCASGEDNCYADNAEICDMYQPCLDLMVSNSSSTGNLSNNHTEDSTELELMPPPKNLKAMCEPDKIFTSPDCRLECHAAACCYDRRKSCLKEQTELCKLYSPCALFYNGVNSTRHNSALKKACDPKVFSKQQETCMELCSEGSCCYLDVSDKESCASNEKFCSHFLPCDVTLTSHIEEKVPQTKSKLSDMCDESVVSKDIKSREKCSRACAGWKCCFLEEKDENNCLSDSSYCDAYSPCLSLAIFDNSTLAIEKVCDLLENDLLSSRVNVCKELCSNGSCCYLPETKPDSCVKDNKFCSRYTSCKKIFANHSTASIPAKGWMNETVGTKESEATSFDVDSDNSVVVNRCPFGQNVSTTEIDQPVDKIDHPVDKIDQATTNVEVEKSDHPTTDLEEKKEKSNHAHKLNSSELCTQERIDSLDFRACFEMCDEWSCCFSEKGCLDNMSLAVPCTEVINLCRQIMDIK
jgi:hypothetical protein